MKHINRRLVQSDPELWKLFRRWTKKHGFPFAQNGTARCNEQIKDFVEAYNHYYRMCPNEKPRYTRQKWRMSGDWRLLPQSPSFKSLKIGETV